MNFGTPEAELAIDVPLVRRLLDEQCPALAAQSIELLDTGWDNASYRVGARQVARLPRRKLAATLIEHEQRWLPEIAQSLSLPVPVPEFVGRRTSYYPWSWSLVPWLPGETADLTPIDSGQAAVWASFLRALHRPAPTEAPENPLRGVPLQRRAVAFQQRLTHLREQDVPVPVCVEPIWQEGLAVHESAESCWLHGDLHARNVLVREGAICGVIDWGDITAGDAATDLASVWYLFADAAARSACLDAYQATADQRTRARGWAALLGVTLLDSGLVDHPRHAAMGQAILGRLEREN